MLTRHTPGKRAPLLVSSESGATCIICGLPAAQGHAYCALHSAVADRMRADGRETRDALLAYVRRQRTFRILTKEAK